MPYSFAMRSVAILFTIAMLVATGLTQQSRKGETFGSETGPFKHPVQLPTAIFHLLTEDKEDFPYGPPKGLHCTDNEEISPTPDEPPERLLCTKVTVSPRKGSDYLIIGVGSLRGAHIVPYWIFHQDLDHPSLLFKTRSDQLVILPNRYHGYHDIESSWVQQAGALVVTMRYRFNGKAYVRIFKQETRN